ncbi:MAG: NADPH-adrenodoxin reductase [Phylliscum demangeonii]|nr:MAG: NADPH-adrenodoxin reductase [Phylliscum demangeonii]
MYERLPVPFGLVRFGVAPDHAEVKNVQDRFTEVASSPRFNFVGNVTIGPKMPLRTLKPHYDAILLAYGASKDQALHIPREGTLKGIYSAQSFVGWYGGLPDYAHLNPDLSVGEEAAVIGLGNAGLDVARILLTDVDELRKTDITSYALDALAKSRIKKVRVLGRRGVMQVELLSLLIRGLPSAYFSAPLDPSLLPPAPAKLLRAPRRMVKLFAEGTAAKVSAATKSWELCPFHSPTAFYPSASDASQVGGITVAKQEIDGPNPNNPNADIRSTGETVDVPASIVIRSIGYSCQPLPGLADFGVPFDFLLGIIPNDGLGRVLKIPSEEPSAAVVSHVPGCYVAGWSKRGPTGVIASTMEDAFETAEAIVQDWRAQAPFLNDGGDADTGTGTGLGWQGVEAEALSNGLRRVSWADWEKIDAAERENGQREGKVRVKFPNVEEMLKVLD